MNLNAVVADAEAMLRRFIGEHIDLVVHLGESLASVRVDPVQIEQVILNLAINSRDAMPHGGTLTIETANVMLAETDPMTLAGLQPGPYVRLAIADTGIGMDDATQEQMFEPFFTTKSPGQGTGLGLSTSYGIVKQSGGDVAVDSWIGRGTTITIYLPRADEARPVSRTVRTATAARGTETIPVVEDDAGVWKMVRRMLGAAGYTVLDAANGTEALELLDRQDGQVHLMLTDRGDARDGHGVLDEGMHFIGKPYATAALTRKVRPCRPRAQDPLAREGIDSQRPTSNSQGDRPLGSRDPNRLGGHALALCHRTGRHGHARSKPVQRMPQAKLLGASMGFAEPHGHGGRAL